MSLSPVNSENPGSQHFLLEELAQRDLKRQSGSFFEIGRWLLVPSPRTHEAAGSSNTPLTAAEDMRAAWPSGAVLLLQKELMNTVYWQMGDSFASAAVPAQIHPKEAACSGVEIL